MKSFNITYKNNKFYDQNTGQRIFPKDGASFLIAGDNVAFNESDSLNIPHKDTNILNSVKKLAEVKRIKHLTTYQLALPAETDIFFEFSITKKKNDSEPEDYRFRIRLLEDLYLHTCSSWKPDKKPTFHDCRCTVEEDLNRNVDYFEPIYALSLNEAYSKTRQFYFPNQGTAGASVFVVMKTRPDYSLETLREHLILQQPWQQV